MKWAAGRWTWSVAGAGAVLAMAVGAVSVGALGADQASTAKTVRVVVDYGDGVEKHFTGLAWRDGVTVFDLLVAAQKHPRGIEVEFKDYGGSIGRMVTGIDGLANGGAGQEVRNWIYVVNEERAKKACDKHVVLAGDRVVWKYDLWKP